MLFTPTLFIGPWLEYIGEISIDESRTGQIFQSDQRAVLVLNSDIPGDFASAGFIGDHLQAHDIRGPPVKIDAKKKWQVPYRPIVYRGHFVRASGDLLR